MWLGLLYLTADDAGARGGAATTVVCVWEAGCEQAMTVVTPVERVADLVRLLCAGAADGAPAPPRCDACGAVIDLPPLL